MKHRGNTSPKGRGLSIGDAIEKAFKPENIIKLRPQEDGTVHRYHHMLPSMIGKAGQVLPDRVKKEMVAKNFVFKVITGTGRMTKWEITPPPRS